MKCRNCGNREFDFVVMRTYVVRYDETDRVEVCDSRGGCNALLDRHHCTNCGEVLADNDLVSECV